MEQVWQAFSACERGLLRLTPEQAEQLGIHAADPCVFHGELNAEQLRAHLNKQPNTVIIADEHSLAEQLRLELNLPFPYWNPMVLHFTCTDSELRIALPKPCLDAGFKLGVWTEPIPAKNLEKAQKASSSLQVHLNAWLTEWQPWFQIHSFDNDGMLVEWKLRPADFHERVAKLVNLPDGAGPSERQSRTWPTIWLSYEHFFGVCVNLEGAGARYWLPQPPGLGRTIARFMQYDGKAILRVTNKQLEQFRLHRQYKVELAKTLGYLDRLHNVGFTKLIYVRNDDAAFDEEARECYNVPVEFWNPLSTRVFKFVKDHVYMDMLLEQSEFIASEFPDFDFSGAKPVCAGSTLSELQEMLNPIGEQMEAKLIQSLGHYNLPFSVVELTPNGALIQWNDSLVQREWKWSAVEVYIDRLVVGTWFWSQGGMVRLSINDDMQQCLLKFYENQLPIGGPLNKLILTRQLPRSELTVQLQGSIDSIVGSIVPKYLEQFRGWYEFQESDGKVSVKSLQMQGLLTLQGFSEVELENFDNWKLAIEYTSVRLARKQAIFPCQHGPFTIEWNKSTLQFHLALDEPHHPLVHHVYWSLRHDDAQLHVVVLQAIDACKALRMAFLSRRQHGLVEILQLGNDFCIAASVADSIVESKPTLELAIADANAWDQRLQEQLARPWFTLSIVDQLEVVNAPKTSPYFETFKVVKPTTFKAVPIIDPALLAWIKAARPEMLSKLEPFECYEFAQMKTQMDEKSALFETLAELREATPAPLITILNAGIVEFSLHTEGMLASFLEQKREVARVVPQYGNQRPYTTITKANGVFHFQTTGYRNSFDGQQRFRCPADLFEEFIEALKFEHAQSPLDPSVISGRSELKLVKFDCLYNVTVDPTLKGIAPQLATLDKCIEFAKRFERQIRAQNQPLLVIK